MSDAKLLYGWHMALGYVDHALWLQVCGKGDESRTVLDDIDRGMLPEVCAALRAVTAYLDLVRQSPTAEALLAPDALPDGVEAHQMGGRR